MSKKIWLVGTLAVVVSFGCTRSSSVMASGGQYSGITITHQTFLNPKGETPRERAVKKIIENFEKKTGAKVKVEIVPWNEIKHVILSRVAAGNPPDVTRLDSPDFERIVAAGAIIPLDEVIKASFSSAELEKEKEDRYLWDVGVKNGKKYTYIISVVATAVFVRKDWLEEAGLDLPTTWTDFVIAGQALAKDGHVGYMTWASPKDPGSVRWYFGSMIHGAGGRILDEAGKAVFNNPAGIWCYAFHRDLVHKYKVLPESVVNATYEDMTDMFEGGIAAMTLNGSHRYKRITERLGKEKVVLMEFPSFSGIPPSPTTLMGWNLAIPKGARNPDAAWEFVKYYTSPEGSEIYTTTAAVLPARRSTARLPYFKTEEAAHLNWWFQYIEKSSEFLLRPKYSTELNEIMQIALQKVILYPTQSISEIVDEAVKEYNKLLE
jgi:multiple sugar transport system substrate-binding protein